MGIGSILRLLDLSLLGKLCSWIVNFTAASQYPSPFKADTVTGELKLWIALPQVRKLESAGARHFLPSSKLGSNKTQGFPLDSFNRTNFQFPNFLFYICFDNEVFLFLSRVAIHIHSFSFHCIEEKYASLSSLYFTVTIGRYRILCIPQE